MTATAARTFHATLGSLIAAGACDSCIGQALRFWHEHASTDPLWVRILDTSDLLTIAGLDGWLDGSARRCTHTAGVTGLGAACDECHGSGRCPDCLSTDGRHPLGGVCATCEDHPGRCVGCVTAQQ